MEDNFVPPGKSVFSLQYIVNGKLTQMCLCVCVCVCVRVFPCGHVFHIIERI